MDTIKDTVSRFREIEPQLWQSVKPKTFKNVDSFGDYRSIYVCHAATIWNAINYPNNTTAISTMRIASAEIQNKTDNPTYFVSNELFDACINTNIDFDTFDISEMRLPFESFNFVLPKGCLTVKQYTVEAITVTRANYDVICNSVEKFNTIPVITTLTPTTHFSIQVHTTNTRCAPFVIIAEDEITRKYLHLLNQEPSDSDKELDIILDKAKRIVFNLLFAMAARPEYIERGQKLGVHKKSKSELWSPNLIGRKYQIKYANDVEKGTHSSPRLHWRRGHFRQQAYGQGHTEHKIIWLEPVLVGVK